MNALERVAEEMRGCETAAHEADRSTSRGLLRGIDAGQPSRGRLPLGVSTATIERWRRRQRETGRVAPSPRAGLPRRIGPAQEDALVAQDEAV